MIGRIEEIEPGKANPRERKWWENIVSRESRKPKSRNKIQSLAAQNIWKILYTSLSVYVYVYTYTERDIYRERDLYSLLLLLYKLQILSLLSLVWYLWGNPDSLILQSEESVCSVMARTFSEITRGPIQAVIGGLWVPPLRRHAYSTVHAESDKDWWRF